MSLLGTLAKVAVGVAVAKGVKSMTGSGRGGGGLLGAALGAAAGNGGALQDMMGAVLGGKSGGGAGLGGLLQSLNAPSSRGTRQASAGGIGDLLGAALGGGQSGGLGQLLGGLAAGGAAGGLGGLLAGKGGFGDLLNASLANQGEPEQAPSADQEAVAGLMIYAMIQAAKCDGAIDQSEQDKLMGKLGEIDAKEQALVNAALSAEANPQALAEQVPSGLEAQVYTMSVMAIDLDNQTEAQYLDTLAKALGLAQADVNHIHTELGQPALYA